MKMIENLKKLKWINLILFYILVCGLSYLLIQFPNFIKEFWIYFFDINAPFGWNHGIALLIASIIGYRVFRTKRETTFFGNKPLYSIIFGSLFIVAYTIAGLSNKLGIDKHLWALIYTSSTLIYDIFEESVWRGFINDSLTKIPFWLKGIITGILWGLWHLIVFDNFEQYGGLHVFVLFSIVASIIMAYATNKTNSILVASSIHALLILRNMNVTIIVAIIWIVMIIIWNRSILQNKTTEAKGIIE